jgi:hypothetical protein
MPTTQVNPAALQHSRIQSYRFTLMASFFNKKIPKNTKMSFRQYAIGNGTLSP